MIKWKSFNKENSKIIQNPEDNNCDSMSLVSPLPSPNEIISPIGLRRIRSANTKSLHDNFYPYPSSYSQTDVEKQTQCLLKPISAHYSLNATLLQEFYSMYQSKRYYTALEIGMQFCRCVS